jgi:hypothetical protein
MQAWARIHEHSLLARDECGNVVKRYEIEDRFVVELGSRKTRRGRAVWDWLVWVLLGAGLVGVFVLWDLMFCGGERCRDLIGRLRR